jgi:nicotinamide-nucleotide amidase
MQLMWIKEIYPKLKHSVGSNIILSRTLKTFGLGEAKVDELVSTFLQSSNPTLATYAKSDGIHLRITAKASRRSAAEKLIARREADIRTVLNDYIWGTDSSRLEDIIGMMLTENGLSLATMESDTGGLLANSITNVPESSIYYKGGLIAYSNEAKIAFGINADLISKYGSISKEVAEAMAITARKNFDSDIGISITGVMEPTEMESRSPGTVFIGIDDGKKRYTFARNYPGERLQIKQRAVTSALFELQKILRHGGNHAPHY